MERQVGRVPVLRNRHGNPEVAKLAPRHVASSTKVDYQRRHSKLTIDNLKLLAKLRHPQEDPYGVKTCYRPFHA